MVPASQAWTLVKPDSAGSPWGGCRAGLWPQLCWVRTTGCAPPGGRRSVSRRVFSAPGLPGAPALTPLPWLAFLVLLSPRWGSNLTTCENTTSACVLSWRRPMVCPPQLCFPETEPSCRLPSRRGWEFMNGHKEVARDPAGEGSSPEGSGPEGRTDRPHFVSWTNPFSPLSWGFKAATTRHQPGPEGGGCSSFPGPWARLEEEARFSPGAADPGRAQAWRGGRDCRTEPGPGCFRPQAGRGWRRGPVAGMPRPGGGHRAGGQQA